MRLAALIAIVCALACAAGVFLPAGQLEVGGALASNRTSRSLFELGRSTGAVQAFLARYQGSTAKKLGSRALDKLAPHVPRRLQSRTADLQDAVATLDDLREEDVRTVGTVTAATMWSLLGLDLLLIALVAGVGPRTSRLRIAAALAVSLVTALVAVAVYLVLDRVVHEANAELGYAMFSLRIGAYLMPIAAVASTVAVIALLVAYLGERAAARGAAARAPAPAR